MISLFALRLMNKESPRCCTNPQVAAISLPLVQSFPASSFHVPDPLNPVLVFMEKYPFAL